MTASGHPHGKRAGAPSRATGKLRIGDDWNAITIIALSQENPLKAVAEFVENAIDAGARNVTITRGRERGEHYLMVVDDGAGVPRDADGMPDFRYVATHRRHARKELPAAPRQSPAELPHHLPVPATPQGEAYLELYLGSPDPANAVGLYRSGTRILPPLPQLPAVPRPPRPSG